MFERDEVLTQTGQPYSVFTPYKRAWLAKVDAFYLEALPGRAATPMRWRRRPTPLRAPVPALAEIGFEPTNLSDAGDPDRQRRAAPRCSRTSSSASTATTRRATSRSVRGPSYLGVHLRFGTVSIRQLAGVAHQLSLQGNAGAATWLSELIWRDFYFQILAHHPQVAEAASRSFRPEYDGIQWQHGKHADHAVRRLVPGPHRLPAGRRRHGADQPDRLHAQPPAHGGGELPRARTWGWTGAAASATSPQHLNDFELASNNGGWQWASSSGCDAQPYFRIFNPVTQSERFDPEGKFIRRYLPQLAKLSNKVDPRAVDRHRRWSCEAAGRRRWASTYPKPVVDHAEARDRTPAAWLRRVV